jgi:hypothetical protein
MVSTTRIGVRRAGMAVLLRCDRYAEAREALWEEAAGDRGGDSSCLL